MGLQIEIYDTFTLYREGEEMPPPPDRTVEALLFGLIFQESRWMSRIEIARKLYPTSDDHVAQNALRQSIYRLRQWLGQDVIESKGRLLRLIPQGVLINWPVTNPADIERVDPARIAPWLSHPWANSLRNGLTPLPAQKRLDVEKHLSRAVESALIHDQVAARRILHGGLDVFETLPIAELGRLLRLTQPRTSSDPLAYEHLHCWGEYFGVTGAMLPALDSHKQAFQVAQNLKLRSKSVLSACGVVFAALEIGDTELAKVWLERAKNKCKSSVTLVTVAIAEAAYLWNINCMHEALTTMQEVEPAAVDVERKLSVHYWLNLGVLAAESGDCEASISARAAADKLIISEISPRTAWKSRFAHGSRLMAEGNFVGAHQEFLEIAKHSRESSLSMAEIYALEASAESLAMNGQHCMAVQAWQQAKTLRGKGKMGASPRVTARKERIKACLA